MIKSGEDLSTQNTRAGFRGRRPNTMGIPWHLLMQLAYREVAVRYKGAFLGIFASLISPLLLLVIYSVVFGWIFNGHYGLKPNETRMDYALGLFCGLVIFNYFAECLTRAPSLVLSNPNYVTKVVFPIEIIPIAVNISALFHLCVNGILLLVVLMSTHGGLPLGALWLFVVLVPLILFAQGVLWIFSALGVFVRDMVLVIPPFTQMLMFGSAVFYTIGSLPKPFAAVIAWNPLAQICEMARRALIAGQRPSLIVLCGVTLASIVVCFLGYEFFRRCKPVFADVL